MGGTIFGNIGDVTITHKIEYGWGDVLRLVIAFAALALLTGLFSSLGRRVAA